MQSLFNGIIVIVGSYGSGKTEVAINLAIDQKSKGRKVCLADLDLVNPYFRTRQARRTLTTLGIEMILPPEQLMQADLPILVPQVAGRIRNPGELVILDVGGDKVGATVLAALSEAFQGQAASVLMLQVVNPFRPTTDSVAGCLRMRAAIEATARLTVHGWIGNAHLMEETRPDHIHQGFQFMQSLASASGLPLFFITVAQDLLSTLDTASVACPILPIGRQLVPPWKKPVALSLGNTLPKCKE